MLVKQEFFNRKWESDQYAMMILFHEAMHKATEQLAKDQATWEVQAWKLTMRLYEIYRDAMGKGFVGIEAYYEKYQEGDAAFEAYVRQQYQKNYGDTSGGKSAE